MFRVVFNTAFVQTNMLMLGAQDIDVDEKCGLFFKAGFRAEV